MDKLPNDNMNSAYMAANLHEVNELLRKNLEAEEVQKIENQNAPLVKELQSVVLEVQRQNKILSEQIFALKEQNELLREMYERVKIEAEENKKQAKNNKIFGWVSFAVGVAIGIAGVLCGIFF